MFSSSSICCIGKLFLITVAYLPELEKNNPIVRDFDYTSVRYRTMNGEEATYQDNIPLDSKVLAPTIPIQYGEEESFFIVDIISVPLKSGQININQTIPEKGKN